MKTKTILLLCLLMGIGLTYVSAQNDKGNVNHAYASWWNQVEGWLPLACSDADLNDPNVEWLQAVVDIHVVEKWKDGHPYLTIWKVRWPDAESTSGEVFKVNEKDIFIEEYNQEGDWTVETIYWYAVITGNWGSKYHVVIKDVWTYVGPGPEDWTEDFTVISADCK
jgi:hypothetical protein